MQPRWRADGGEENAITFDFELECIAGGEVKFVPNRLGENQAARLVNI